jgi:DnaJ domain
VSPHRILGLAADATEPEIKRAYARLLKQHRPDEDPEGFQRLHEAYGRCLAFAQKRASGPRRTKVQSSTPLAQTAQDIASPGGMDADPVADSPLLPGTVPALQPDSSVQSTKGHPDRMEPEQTTKTPELAALEFTQATAKPQGKPSRPRRTEPVFRPGRFLEEMTQRASEATASELLDWLHAHPALYSLDTKDALAERLVHHLSERPALPPEHLRALLRFFDLDTINPRAQRLQWHIERLYRRSAEASGDWDDVAYMYEQPRASGSKSGGHWWPWGLTLFILIRIVVAAMSSS